MSKRAGNRGAGGRRSSNGPKQGGPKQGGSKQGGQRQNGPKQSIGDRGGPRANRGGSRSQGRSGRGRSAAAKRGLGGDLVEGRQAVRELLLAQTRRVHEIVMIEDLAPADILDDISELSFEMKVPLRAVPRRRFESEAATESHQGVLAKAAPLPERSLEELADVPNAHLLVLDGVTDPGNLGALLRTAECAGVTGVVLPRHRAVHVSPTVTKTAAGAVEHVPMAVVGGIPTAINDLHKLGVTTIGLDMDGPTSVFELPLQPEQPVALVLGAEGAGLSRLVRQRVEVMTSIPMLGQLNSLNVAMAGAVAMFEVMRARTAAGKGS